MSLVITMISLSYYNSLYTFFITTTHLIMFPVITLHHYIDTIKTNYQNRQKKLDEITYECEQWKSKTLFFQEQYIKLQSSIWYQSAIASLENHTNETHHITASILSRFFSSYEHYFFIDKGSIHGITVNMVVCSNHALIGKISQVGPLHSKVMLITDQKCIIPIIYGEERTHATCQGTNSEHLVLKYKDPIKSIERYEMAITSGSGFVFPYGIGVGLFDTYDDHNDVFIRPFIDFKTINHCSIITK